MKDYRRLSRKPELSYAQQQTLPTSPRAEPAEPATRYLTLKTLLSANALSWVKRYVRYRIGRRAPFRHYRHLLNDDGIYLLEAEEGGEVRVALAGDWGTGTNEAFRVAELIDEFKPHFSIHLGDVYFVGDPNEVRENFLGIANRRHQYTPCKWPDGTRGTFALNGNHEMYARGLAYFWMMLPNLGMRHADRALGQKASFFCLENAHWRVIALDTAYNAIGWPIFEYFSEPDCALHEELIAWLRDTLRQVEDGRAVVLLSHHQYCSRFDKRYPRPAQQLAEFLRRPVLWFWAHEHRLVVYEPTRDALGFPIHGRCLGHGGMPVEHGAAVLHPDCAIEFMDEREYPNEEKIAVGYNGFSRLRFHDDLLHVEYVDVDDHVVCSESWHADPDGTVTRVAFQSAL